MRDRLLVAKNLSTITNRLFIAMKACNVNPQSLKIKVIIVTKGSARIIVSMNDEMADYIKLRKVQYEYKKE